MYPFPSANWKIYLDCLFLQKKHQSVFLRSFTHYCSRHQLLFHIYPNTILSSLSLPRHLVPQRFCATFHFLVLSNHSRSDRSGALHHLNRYVSSVWIYFKALIFTLFQWHFVMSSLFTAIIRAFLCLISVVFAGAARDKLKLLLVM